MTNSPLHGPSRTSGTETNGSGMLYVVGLGPGSREHMTGAALSALKKADVIVGYTPYVQLASKLFPTTPTHTTGMGGERERCLWAVHAAAEGRCVALVCSGDAGVYGMAALALDLLQDEPNAKVEIVPGVTAALSGAAVLGAPLTNDFCTISLSDYLTPWDVVEHRLHHAAQSGMAICLYNPASRHRLVHLRKACDILLEHRDPSTACGWVRNIARVGQSHKICSLSELRDEQVDMFTTVFVGAPQTVVRNGRLVTPRSCPSTIEPSSNKHAVGKLPAPVSDSPDGTAEKTPGLISDSPDGTAEKTIAHTPLNVLLFGGTTEGRVLANELILRGHKVTVSVATPVGAEELVDASGAKILVGRLDAPAIARLATGFDLCIDATHPYAQAASEAIRTGCASTGIEVVRVVRKACADVSDAASARDTTNGSAANASAATGSAATAIAATVATTNEAAEFLATTEGAILVTTGSKELSAFGNIDPRRLYVRVLPTHEGIAACERIGIPHRNIVALRGPFSRELNEAILRQYGIRWLVTKDGGRAGGFEEKLLAAQACNVHCVLIRRPDETGISVEQLLQRVGKVQP